MNHLITKITILLLCSFLGIANLAAAIPDMQNGQNKPKTGQPPEKAISVCSGKIAKSTCNFQGPRGAESGFCEYTPDKKYFACNPNRAAQGNNPPPRNSNGK